MWNSSESTSQLLDVSGEPSGTPLKPSSYSGVGGGLAVEENGGPILPEMPPEEELGFALREWRRLNAIRLEEKERKEKKLREVIIEEADAYKAEFYRKRQIAVESNKSSNREMEKSFLANRDRFHAEAEKNYWGAISDLIPKEVPTIEKRGKKEQDKKKPSILVIQGPKPGKPTNLSRMHHILLKLKHNTPPHMKFKQPMTGEPKAEGAGGAPEQPSGAASTAATPDLAPAAQG